MRKDRERERKSEKVSEKQGCGEGRRERRISPLMVESKL